jgi:hypothetical protein
MKHLIFIATALISIGCGESKRDDNSEIIPTASLQDSIFNTLLELTDNTLPDNVHNDSLAFLILPVQASCPACRKKTIDSIVKHQASLAANRYIIITAKGGRRTINSYFRELDHQLPIINGRLFLDTLNQAHHFNLFKDNPAIYYTAEKKTYKRVFAIPATIRNDLSNFFSGSNNNEQNEN